MGLFRSVKIGKLPLLKLGLFFHSTEGKKVATICKKIKRWICS